ncbi:multiple epidermal growth factor-like domains protein 10 isoform X11 [Haliotis rubra]|uniref:multiple epidermal growth factor-like domains protein 10 isoform X11 n=1 Tax=Haliotis rubra TaxID=36100 RepID=UPI001EE513E9|nr:multiple epidermal growth factor-like domains protein 10 isoform X11 [Haliotis rubra]XP_046553385.1 multiple epidermal growth factor-like domains protein 10 isoform X11 [Haliotis rubra]
MAVRDGVVILLASFSLVTGTATNVALNKPALMSSALDGNHPASKAVDGDTSAEHQIYVAHTGTGQTIAWWKVDLQTQVQSARIILYFRTNYKYRRNGVQLYTSGKNSSEPTEGNLCHTVTGRRDGTGIGDVLNVTCLGTWRYLTVYTETDNDGYGAILDFDEVQVWTCLVGMYGVNCNKACNSRHCYGSTESCDSVTGACSSGQCQTGWTGTDCAVCASGQYGANCAKDCSSRHCKTSSPKCDRISGACPTGGCDAGWMGTDCSTECASGYYGANCGKNCTLRHCKGDSSCDRIQGLCKGGCAAGYDGTDCTEACTSQMYGPNCVSSCSARHCKTNSSTCDGASGECLGGCEDGWTEIDCSSKVVNCSDGRYGPGCTEFCNSRNCKTPSTVCDVTGSCADGCREGWQNTDCRTPCPSGTYGSNCSKTCDSRQCKTARTICDHVSGACTTGCREGWIGADCTQRCKPGTYGPDCSRCGHSDVTCNVGDGRCPGECLEGFTGDRCDVDVRASSCIAKMGRHWMSYRNGYRNSGHAAAGCCSVRVSAKTWKTEMDSLKRSRTNRRKKDRLHWGSSYSYANSWRGGSRLY